VGVQKLLAAFRFLTIWGCIDGSDLPPESVGRAATYFVLVGLVMGLLLALTNYFLQPYLDGEILSLVVVALWITTTGARHLHGLRESLSPPGEKLARTSNTSGFIAVMLVILLKSAATESVDEIATLSLFLTPVLARWGLLVFVYGYGSRFDEATSRLAAQVRLPAVLFATAISLGTAAYFLSRKGLWIAFAVSLAALLLREWFFRRHRVVSRAHLDAAVETSEVLSLVLLAAL
jgi:adenosylcobinamide-GDP ribazoletransferase